MEDKLVKTSKFLSLILRHKPEAIGITLDKNGWANVNELLRNLKITKEQLDEVVETNNKKRFAFNEDETLIRASQGHSRPVDVELEEKEPPKFLYHGSSENKVGILFAEGLKKMKRLHVHLHTTYEEAFKVGKRHGKPIVFQVLSGRMYNYTYKFFLSKNGVWLIDHVPREFLVIINK